MKNITYSVIIVIVVAGLLYLFISNMNKAPAPLVNTTPQEYVSYKSSEYSPEFSYPKSWGEVELREGNTACPEEDTYRTADTVSVSKWHYAFPQISLPNSKSFIRIGILLHEINQKDKNTCGEDFLLKIASGEVKPESLSSFRLNSVTTKVGMRGTFNANASRLNTEHREQYTFFVPAISGGYTVIQPYFSFIPYFGSPELAEMENDFAGDMELYIKNGKTSAPIREYLKDFAIMAEGLVFQGEQKISELQTFVWKYEKANSLNPDGNPQTKVFLEAKYFNGKVESKLIDTTDGSCNDLPEKEAGSVPNGANIQCYYAGLGYRYKITKGIDSYQVQRKAFEEALPNHTPPLYKYEVVAEFPFTN